MKKLFAAVILLTSFSAGAQVIKPNGDERVVKATVLIEGVKLIYMIEDAGWMAAINDDSDPDSEGIQSLTGREYLMIYRTPNDQTTPVSDTMTSSVTQDATANCKALGEIDFKEYVANTTIPGPFNLKIEMRRQSAEKYQETIIQAEFNCVISITKLKPAAF